MSIECPSGMQLEVRGMKGKELKFLQDRQLMKTGAFLDRILGACSGTVIDPGIYEFEGGVIDWDRVLLGDKLFVLLRIRAATFGEKFTFKARCRRCEEGYEWDVMLSDLAIKKLNPEDAEAFRTRIPLSTRIPSTGAVIKFRLATGKDEKIAMKAKSEPNAVIAMLAARIIEIEGAEIGGARRFLEELSLDDIFVLNAEMDRRDCGVETHIETECESCGEVQEVSLPIGTGFLVPKKG